MVDNNYQANSALFPSDEPDGNQQAPIPTASHARASAGSAAATSPEYRRPFARPSITTPGSRDFHMDWSSRPTTPRTFGLTPDRPSQALPSATDFDTLGTSYSEPPRAGVDAKSKLWEYYNNEARVADKDMLRRWQDDMATLLIFAGLFSGGVLTVFLIEFYTTLQPDYGEISIRQQRLISVNLQALLNTTTGAPAYPIFDTTDALLDFQVPRSALWTQGLWFSALVCGISVALLAWLVKSWLLDYVKGMNSGSAYDRAHRRQHRHDALLSWHVPAIIASLPALMHLTVMLFLIGLIILMWELNRVIGYIMLSMVILLACIYAGSTLLPLFWPSCPYRNVVLLLLLEILAPSAHKLVKAVIGLCLKLADWARKHSFIIPQTIDIWLLCHRSYLYDYGQDEQKYIQLSDSVLTWKSVIWLLKYSQNMMVTDICLRSIIGLKFQPEMIDSLLKADVLNLLFSQIAITLPSSDDDFWKTLIPAPVGYLSSQYTTSILCLWQLVSLQNKISLSSIIEITQSQQYAPLYGNWLFLWRKLREKYSFSELPNHNYDTQNLIIIVCTECLYYHLHPDNYLAIHEMQLLERNPLLDLEDLLEKHLVEISISDIYFKQGLNPFSLEIILETLCYSISKVDYYQLIFQRKTLPLLFKLISMLRKEDRYLFNSLALCFTVLATDDCSIKRELLLEYHTMKKNHSESLSWNPYIRIISSAKSILWRHPRLQNEETEDDLLQLVLQLYKFVSRTGTSEVATEDALIELPTPYIDALLLHIHQHQQKCQSPDWLTDFLVKVYLNNILSQSGKERILDIFGVLIADDWSDEVHIRVCMKIFLFLKEQVQTQENTIKICEMFERKLSDTLSQKDRRLLKAFIQCKMVDVVSAILQGPELNKIRRNWLGFVELWMFDKQEFTYTDTELLAYQVLYKACQEQGMVVRK